MKRHSKALAFRGGMVFKNHSIDLFTLQPAVGDDEDASGGI
jgi:hypothetical protein